MKDEGPRSFNPEPFTLDLGGTQRHWGVHAPSTSPHAKRNPMTCHDVTCATPPCWRLTDAERPGLVFHVCAAHVVPLLTASAWHVLERLPEGQPS